jgi:1,4-alpha-glucan branching enzyme
MVAKVEKYINEVMLNELYSEDSNCPHKLLGAHDVEEGQLISAYRFNAEYIKAIDTKTGNVLNLLPIGDKGFYSALNEGEKFTQYVFETKYRDGSVITLADPYQFPSVIGELDIHLFLQGTHYQIYEKLGAHIMTVNGVKGTHFAVWAPNARRVSVIGDFNCWDGRLHPMCMLGSSGIHELFIPGVEEGSLYQFQIKTREGLFLYKTDPYGNCAQLRPGKASVVTDLNDFKWQDKKWLGKRKALKRDEIRREAMSIYEVHLGSWRKRQDGTEDGFYNYREAAHELADYLIEMGYTHVELIGIAEHPFDGSWGYQVTGYYAPTRRYGLPTDFMYFVDYMHSKGIGVLLDWVPAHFPKDENGLARFDGVPLYEHPDHRRGEHPHWGTYIFNYERKEVINFLLANALFWLEKFHIDGLRVDAVASMLYLDYGKEAGQWLPNRNGGRENLDAVEFFKHMNAIIQDRNPGAIVIAEESTSWAGVTAPVQMNGLGFLYKWNMGWMNDFLEYMKLDPYFRQFNHGKLTFSLVYAYSENFIQVLSHDEVVHGKGSMIQKMPGEYEDKFANLRLAYGFMYGHPGKKLLFMGQEFAQWQEWSEARSLDWGILSYDKHAKMREFVKALNRIYQKYNALYVNDFDTNGFEWLDCNHPELSLVAFLRRGNSKRNQLLFICNFTPVERKDYTIGVPCGGNYTIVLNSDDVSFGGKGYVNETSYKAKKVEVGDKDYSLQITIPPLTVMVLSFHEAAKKA